MPEETCQKLFAERIPDPPGDGAADDPPDLAFSCMCIAFHPSCSRPLDRQHIAESPPGDVPNKFHVFPPSCGEGVAELTRFGSALYSNSLPITRPWRARTATLARAARLHEPLGLVFVQPEMC